MTTTESVAPATTNAAGIQKVSKVGSITVDSVGPHTYKKDMDSAQLRQVHTNISLYPSRKTESNMQKSLFDFNDFGLTAQEFESVENRMAFLDIPKGTTKEQVEAKLNAAMANGAVIYKVLSNEPILDDNQLNGIARGLTTKDIIGNGQVLRYPDSDKEGRGGKIIVNAAGNVTYRRTYFWDAPHADVDLRGTSEAYVTPEVEAELIGASALVGQKV